MNVDRLNYLRNNNIIKDDDIFNYEGLDNEQIRIYQFFEKRFVDLLESYSKLFNLKNPLFYIKNELSCNAFASKIQDINMIGITNGYAILMSEKYREDYFSSLIFVALKNNKSISDAYADLFEDSNFEFNQFMLDFSIYYTFGHEFRHLLQFNSINSNKEFLFSENLSQDKFSIKKHAWEFDADRMAAFEVLKFTFMSYRKLEKRDDAKLKCLMYLSAASMLITKILFYFGIMNQLPNSDYKVSKNEFYIKKYSHPHSLIRIISILNYYSDDINDSFSSIDFDRQDFLNNVMFIVNQYLNSIIPKQTIVKDFFDDWSKHSEEINKYNSQLYDYAIKNKEIRNLLASKGVNFEK